MGLPQRGLAFEACVHRALMQLGVLKLERMGGNGDRGLDMVGRWELATRDFGARCWVGVQCKSKLERKRGNKISSAEVREFEGSIMSYTKRKGSDNVLGLLCAHSGFSRHAEEHFRRSSCALALLDFDDLHCTGVSAFQLNDVAKELVPGLHTRYRLLRGQPCLTKKDVALIFFHDANLSHAFYNEQSSV